MGERYYECYYVLMGALLHIRHSLRWSRHHAQPIASVRSCSAACAGSPWGGGLRRGCVRTDGALRGVGLAVLVQAADSISGARPGARKELLENYVKRLEDLEGIATSFDGVSKAYAIQAGREIRVMVNSDMVDDDTTYILCKDIAEKIEKNLTYPGQIRVTVIRERRAVGLAK